MKTRWVRVVFVILALALVLAPSGVVQAELPVPPDAVAECYGGPGVEISEPGAVVFYRFPEDLRTCEVILHAQGSDQVYLGEAPGVQGFGEPYVWVDASLAGQAEVIWVWFVREKRVYLPVLQVQG